MRAKRIICVAAIAVGCVSAIVGFGAWKLSNVIRGWR